MTVQVMEIELAAKQLHEVMEKVPSQILRLEKEIKLCDQETLDLLHLIEMSKFHASEGYKLCRDLQITRLKRRKFKDELEGLTQITEALKAHRPLHHQTQKIDAVVKKQSEIHKSRRYTPRVRSDLIERFSKL